MITGTVQSARSGRCRLGPVGRFGGVVTPCPAPARPSAAQHTQGYTRQSDRVTSRHFDSSRPPITRHRKPRVGHGWGAAQPRATQPRKTNPQGPNLTPILFDAMRDFPLLHFASHRVPLLARAYLCLPLLLAAVLCFPSAFNLLSIGSIWFSMLDIATRCFPLLICTSGFRMVCNRS